MATLTTNADQPNEDQLRGGDLWVDENMGSRLEQLHDQVTKLRQAWSASRRSSRWLMSQRPSKIAAG